MMKLYQQGIAKMQETNQVHSNCKSLNHNSETDFEHWEEECDDLVKWSTNLDFEEYQENWVSMATTGPSDIPAR